MTDTCKLCAGSQERQAEIEVAFAQAVEFAQYVSEHAKGTMVERAKHFLSLKYSQQLAARLMRWSFCPTESGLGNWRIYPEGQIYNEAATIVVVKSNHVAALICNAHNDGLQP